MRNSRLDGGAAARRKADCMSTGSKHCIDANDIDTSGFSDAAVVEQSEIRNCYSRGVRIRRGHLIVRDSWVHHNHRGGLLADATKGKLRTERNVIEEDGNNCPASALCNGGSRAGLSCDVPNVGGCPGPDDNGCPGGECEVNGTFSNEPVACATDTTYAVDEFVVENVVAEVDAARLETDGDVVRNGTEDGIVLRENAEADIQNEFICNMAANGIDVNHDSTPAPTPKMAVRGTASVFSDRGVQIHRDNGDPFGRPGNITFGDQNPMGIGPGNNAFTMNGTNKHNFAYGDVAGGAARFAEGNQWEHCGSGDMCLITSIRNKDVTETGGPVAVDPAQAHRDPLLPMGITSVSPKKITERGTPVFITGTGFNAIDGYQSRTPTPGVTGATDCESLAAGNKCSPLQGVCVEFTDDAGVWRQADDVLAVTPTLIVVRSPIVCSKSASIRVTRQDNSATGSTIAMQTFCTN
jgi:hypothetical protein